jgi:hypothetical protein
MNQKQLRLIAALLGVAVLLYLITLLSRDDGSGTIASDSGFSLQLVGQPTRIDIVRPTEGDTLRLARELDGWTIDGHPADSAKVADLLPALAEARATELVARNPANHEELGVSDGGGRRIEVFTEAGEPAVFFLGKRDMARGGYYVRSPGSDEVFRLEGPVGGFLGRQRDGWRVREIAAVDTAAVREILLRRSESKAALIRSEDGWMVDGEPADSTAVQELLRSLPALSASGFPSDAVALAADFSEPDGTIEVFAVGEGDDVTDRSLVLSLKLLEPEGEEVNWLIRRADETETYGLSSAMVRRLVPERDRLVPEGAPDEPEDRL